MHDSALRKNKYYVDSLSINTERGLRRKICSSAYPIAPVGYINSSRTKIIIAGIAFSSIIVLLLFNIFNSPIQGSYIKPALAAPSQLPQNPVEFIQSAASPEQASPGLPASPAGRPRRLKIPAIGVDAAFEYVGLTTLGAMDTPKGPSDVAWFKLGPRPGDNGSAVIAGHYGRWKNGQGSVFDDLKKLSEGDKLYVKDETGATITFAVRESRRYDPEADASDVFGSNDGGSHLNLIACNGVWNKVSKSYSERLVVFADKVDSTSSTPSTSLGTGGSGQASSPQE